MEKPPSIGMGKVRPINLEIKKGDVFKDVIALLNQRENCKTLAHSLMQIYKDESKKEILLAQLNAQGLNWKNFLTLDDKEAEKINELVEEFTQAVANANQEEATQKASEIAIKLKDQYTHTQRKMAA
jgi:exopolysaccharide biosynthesis protein